MGVPVRTTDAGRIEGGSAREARLVEACRKGDAAAFDALLRHWQKPLFNFVYRHLGDPALAEDLVQETFVRVVQSIRRYAHRGSFSTWLYRIALNLCRDHRRKKRLPVVSLHDYVTTDAGDTVFVKDRLADDGAPTDAAAEAADREELAKRLLGGLSEVQREVILLKEYQGLTFAEIAEVLGVPENTAKARLYRGLRAMRERLEREEPWQADGPGGRS